MQNNVTDLSQKLQRSLDNNYNVIDMPAVVEIISTLEKTAVTKELLETTRLGKHINELRRRTTNESLAKRAKELVKKWRDLILPEANGQSKPPSVTTSTSERSDSPAGLLKSRKRTGKDRTDEGPNAKRPLLNGQSREYDFSDNSNCSIKDSKKSDVIFINSDSNSSVPDQSNDSFSRSQSNDAFEELGAQQPKKRGRKKGSKNHKNLIVAAEESFSNKMSAISRNSKVKTTQELLADLQNRTSTAKPDIELRAAQLTESLSRIDQKLNPQKKINQNVAPVRDHHRITRNDAKATKVEDSDARFNRLLKGAASPGASRVSTPDVVLIVQSDDEIVDVVGTDPAPAAHSAPPTTNNTTTTTMTSTSLVPPSLASLGATAGIVGASEPLTIEGILAKLPPVDRTALERPDDEFPLCACPVPECREPDNITVQIVTGGAEKKEPYCSIFCTSPPSSPAAEPPPDPPEAPTAPDPPIEDVDPDADECLSRCPTRMFMRELYRLTECASDGAAERLKHVRLDNVNGNAGLPGEPLEPAPSSPPYDIVPTLAGLRMDASPAETYNKYSISISERTTDETGCDTVRTFREWHETLDTPSYDGQPLRILPYVIID